MTVNSPEVKKIISSGIVPLIFVLVLWLILISEGIFDYNLVEYGLYPREIGGLKGILTSVFIHGDWKHLFNNSLPLIILGWALFYFYREVALKICLFVILMGGLWTWISAREAHHIGASGLIYGLFSFLLFSGFIRKNKRLVAISFLVAFLYGSLVWGILPIDYTMSWESHFWGFIAGFALAVYYRKIGVQREEYKWDEEEEKKLDNVDYWKGKDDRSPYRFIYKSKKGNGD